MELEPCTVDLDWEDDVEECLLDDDFDADVELELDEQRALAG